MTDYSLNLQKNLKRNYFQSFQPNHQTIPSNVQIDDNYHRFEILVDSSLPSEAIINNFLPIQTNEINNPVIHPVQSDITTLRQRRTSR
ncbi:unnamed protein product, partial [Rotaria magnacalcarata]